VQMMTGLMIDYLMLRVGRASNFLDTTQPVPQIGAMYLLFTIGVPVAAYS